MSQTPLSANDAWRWIVRGWQLFMKDPVIWAVLALMYIVSLFVLNTLPMLGTLLAALLTPVLLAGMLHGAQEVDAGRKLLPLHILQGFQQQGRLIQLVLLGLVPLSATLLQKAVLTFAIPQGLAALLGLMLSLAAACVLLYSLPQVMLENRQALEAVPRGLRVCLRQPLATGIFLGLALVLVVLALIPLGLGLFVCLPILVGAMYASYRQAI